MMRRPQIQRGGRSIMKAKPYLPPPTTPEQEGGFVPDTFNDTLAELKEILSAKNMVKLVFGKVFEVMSYMPILPVSLLGALGTIGLAMETSISASQKQKEILKYVQNRNQSYYDQLKDLALQMTAKWKADHPEKPVPALSTLIQRLDKEMNEAAQRAVDEEKQQYVKQGMINDEKQQNVGGFTNAEKQAVLNGVTAPIIAEGDFIKDESGNWISRIQYEEQQAMMERRNAAMKK